MLKEEAVIEVVTEQILVDLIEEEEYVLVFFRYCPDIVTTRVARNIWL